MKHLALIIRTHLLAIATLISGGALLVCNLQAQDGHAITVTVPFAFTANSEHFSAGTYQLRQLTEWFVSIRSLNSGSEHLMMVHPGQMGAPESRGYLTFQRFEGLSHLEGVYIPGTDMQSELIHHHEREIGETRAYSSDGSTTAFLKKTRNEYWLASKHRRAGDQ